MLLIYRLTNSKLNTIWNNCKDNVSMKMYHEDCIKNYEFILISKTP